MESQQADARPLRDDGADDRDFGLIYGVLVACLVSAPLWAAIVWGVWRAFE